MSANHDWKGDISGQAKERTILVCAILLDLFYFVPWYVAQWLMSKLLELLKINLSILDQWQIIIIQIFFAISTLIPIIAFTLKDATIICIRMWREVKNELNEVPEPISNIVSPTTTQSGGIPNVAQSEERGQR